MGMIFPSNCTDHIRCCGSKFSQRFEQMSGKPDTAIKATTEKSNAEKRVASEYGTVRAIRQAPREEPSRAAIRTPFGGSVGAP